MDENAKDTNGRLTMNEQEIENKLKKRFVFKAFE